MDTGTGTVSIKENGKNVESQNEDEEVKVEGDENQGQVKIKTKNGESIIAYNKNALANGFPKDIPIYLPSTVQMSQNIDNGKNVMASLNTGDNTDKVVRFYKKALPQAGWAVKGEMNMRSTALLQGEKGGKELNVTVKEEQGRTVISLVEGNK